VFTLFAGGRSSNTLRVRATALIRVGEKDQGRRGCGATHNFEDDGRESGATLVRGDRVGGLKSKRELGQSGESSVSNEAIGRGKEIVSEKVARERKKKGGYVRPPRVNLGQMLSWQPVGG